MDDIFNKQDFSDKRFVGGNLPRALVQLFDEVRGERGISTRTAALEEAVALWVYNNTPSDEVHRKIAELMKMVDVAKAARQALDTAINEWRHSRDPELLEKIVELAETTGIELPVIVRDAIAAQEG